MAARCVALARPSHAPRFNAPMTHLITTSYRLEHKMALGLTTAGKKLTAKALQDVYDALQDLVRAQPAQLQQLLEQSQFAQLADLLIHGCAPLRKHRDVLIKALPQADYAVVLPAPAHLPAAAPPAPPALAPLPGYVTYCLLSAASVPVSSTEIVELHSSATAIVPVLLLTTAAHYSPPQQQQDRLQRLQQHQPQRHNLYLLQFIKAKRVKLSNTCFPRLCGLLTSHWSTHQPTSLQLQNNCSSLTARGLKVHTSSVSIGCSTILRWGRKSLRIQYFCTAQHAVETLTVQ